MVEDDSNLMQLGTEAGDEPVNVEENLDDPLCAGIYVKEIFEHYRQREVLLL